MRKSEMMPDMRIRNVPPALHKALKVLAVEQDTTLEKLVIEILRDAVVRMKQGKK